jgi:transcriptional regulator with XRE-family HTH domain
VKLEWKLRNYLENHSLTGRALALEAGLAPQAIYRILKAEGPDYLHRPTLEKVLTALSKLTGSPVTPNDLLEVVEVIEETESEPDPILLEGDASSLGRIDPYDWGSIDPSNIGEPIEATNAR